MKKTNHRQFWLETGYNLFAEEGHEGIQIERLARITGLNKSGFYHYFGDVHEFLKLLVQEHDRVIDGLLSWIGSLESYDPGFFDFMIQNKTVCFFHIQLIRNNHVKIFKEAHERNNLKIDPLVIASFSRELGLTIEVANPFYEYLRDTFYTRVDFRQMDYEFLHSTLENFKTTVKMMIESKS